MAKIYTDEHIPAEFTQELQEIFSQFDRHGNGTVDIRELVRAMDKNISKEYIEEIIQEFCSENDGKLRFEDFERFLLKKMKGVDCNEEVKDMFMVLDRTDSGYFTPEELRRAILSVGETISLDEATELINSIETNEPGKINYNEFCHIVKDIIGRK